MARVSPLAQHHDKAGALLSAYGPAEGGVPVTQTYGELALEYAAIRRSGALFDWPHRGTLVIGGTDRIEFLNRMVTQELRGVGPLEPMRSRWTFWLNRKGRIDADLRLVELGDRMLVDVDVFAADRARAGLGEFVITEDVTIEDATDRFHRLGVHGARAREALAHVSSPVRGPTVADLQPDHVTLVQIAGHEVVVDRWDACGEPGLELTVAAAHAREVYEQLLSLAHESHHPVTSQSRRGDPSPSHRLTLRPAGWLAFNTARIEAGTPLYNIDFGADSLPHETGLVSERVSFKKGCYLGQEVVARMQSRGHSKRTLVAIRGVDDAPPSPYERPLPVAGAHVVASDAPDAESVGSVTSSTLSPRLGGAVIAFASAKPGHTAPGTTLYADAEGTRARVVVQPTLRFLPS